MMVDYLAARSNMVEGQVKPNRVTDVALLNAMLNVPRERFVPPAARGVAYVDEDIPISPGRWLIEPMVLGRLLNEAQIEPASAVLIVGAGTGYSAAVAARLAARVVALESEPALAAAMQATLAELGVANVVVAEGPLPAGWPGAAPYDAILIDGAVAAVPEALAAQLSPGGRLVTVVIGAGRLGRAMLYRETGGSVASRPLFDAATPPLREFAAKPAFEF